MTYNQTRVNGVAMPLLMGCTEPSVITQAGIEPSMVYNPYSQIVNWDTASVHMTMCVKRVRCDRGGNKNTQDDKRMQDDKKVY